MQVVGFKIFSSNRVFMEWQVKNPLVKIHTVIPQYSAFGGEQAGERLDLNLEYRVFVTYLQEVEPGNNEIEEGVS